MNRNRKKYVQINNHTPSHQTAASLGNVQRDEEEDIEELTNGSDTEFFSNNKDLEDIVPYSDDTDILTPVVSIHIVKYNKKEPEKDSKSKLEELKFQWRPKIAPIIRKECNLVG